MTTGDVAAADYFVWSAGLLDAAAYNDIAGQPIHARGARRMAEVCQRAARAELDDPEPADAPLPKDIEADVVRRAWERQYYR